MVKIFLKIFFFLFLLVFTLDAKADVFTPEEKDWILSHKEIKVGVEKDWFPFDYTDEKGRHQGISKDYLEKISQISGLKFITYSDKWVDLLEKIESKEIDLLPALYYSKDREPYIEFTNKYLNLAEYLFTQIGAEKLTGPADAHGKTLAVVRGYEVIQWIRKRHPKVKIIVKETLYDCIQAVSVGEAFGFIGDLPSAQFILETYFINNIKINTIISDRDPVGVYMGTRKDYGILAQIISKSFDQISRKQKEKIFEKYAKEHRKKGLRGAFGFGRPPYMYGKNSGKGIEEILARQALAIRGFKLSEVRQMPIERGQDIVIQDSEIDFSVGVLENKEDGLYYSDDFVKYENVAVSRSKDKLKIQEIKDLRGKKIVAWDQAYNMLGSEFKEYFSPLANPKNYKEIFDQKLQHQVFFKKESDLILVDKNIFTWYVNKYREAYDADQEYDIHNLFSTPVWIKVSFRDKRLRDEFNLGLKEIKQSGLYKEIISDFLKVDLEKQLKLVQLIASISAEYIYENNTKVLKTLLSKFDNISIIKGIEFISANKKQSVLKLEKSQGKYIEIEEFSWGDSQMGMIQKSSYLHEDGNTVDVGGVKVYYEINDVKEVAISYIPDLQNFKSLGIDNYEKVSLIYKRLKLGSDMTQLSVSEQKWIQEHPLIRFVGDPNWLPFEAFNEEGKYIGIVAEYLKEIENITGLKFERIQTSSWDESVSLMKAKKVDLISETTDSQMSSYLSFTDAYLENHIVIVMDSKEKYVDNISQIQEKKIVIIKDYGYVSKIKKSYPNIDFVEAENISQALKIVSSGRADALLCAMALGSYHISKDGFVNLRIVGKTEFSTSLGYGVQPELKPLVNILNKAILTLAEGKKQEILKKWIAQKYIEKIDYTLVWQILGAAAVLLSLFWYWNRQMRKEIGRRKVAEEQLQEVNDMVKDSIQFSSMIQQALIPTAQSFESICPDSFAIWKPRDIVGGDIYFIEKLRHDKEEFIIMMIDCTGHGVPGAFVTMLVKAIERNIVGHIKGTDEKVSPSKLLSIFNTSMKHLLKQENKNSLSNAGFDAAIVYINKDENTFIYAGAEIPLYYLDTKETMVFIKGNRHSIGYRTSNKDYVFKDHRLRLDEIRRFYLSSDGYIDQNGGNKGFPFGKKRFIKLLQEGKNLDMKVLEKRLLDELQVYQGEYERNDDIAIVGIEIQSLFQVEEILLQYQGYITQDKLCSFLDEVENTLKDRKNDEKVLPKVFAILTEQMQNVMSYSKDSIMESENIYKSEGDVIFGFDHKKQKYFVSTRNKMSKNSETPLRTKLEKVNSLNTQELREYYKELRKSGSKKHTRGAGLGFLEMAKKSSEPLEYNIQEEQGEDYTFEIKVYI